MSKHTPGPWDWFIGKPNNKQASREPQMRLLIGSNGQGFAHTVGLSREEDEANVRLMAAAPTMLEALNETYKLLGAFGSHATYCSAPDSSENGCACGFTKACDLIQAAIKLAEGDL